MLLYQNVKTTLFGEISANWKSPASVKGLRFMIPMIETPLAPWVPGCEGGCSILHLSVCICSSFCILVSSYARGGASWQPRKTAEFSSLSPTQKDTNKHNTWSHAPPEFSLCEKMFLAMPSIRFQEPQTSRFRFENQYIYIYIYIN